MKKIKVYSEGKMSIAVEKLHGIQGKLKEMSEPDFELLKKTVINDGICFVHHVWKEKTEKSFKWRIIDGHGRALMYKHLKKEGYEIPDIPCAEIFGKTFKEAKLLVLNSSSTYNKVTPDGLFDFLKDIDESPDILENYSIDEIDLPSFKSEFYDQEIFKSDTILAEIPPEVEFSREINEKNNYIVLLFSKKDDFKIACEKLKVKRVKYDLSPTRHKAFLHTGIGRIIDGKATIDRL